MADSTRAMRRAIFDRDIVPTWRNRLLKEISPDDLRGLCKKVKDRGAPATAIHVRDIVKQIFAFVILHGATIRLGLRLILLTMVRKSELQDAVWDEVDLPCGAFPKGA